METITFNCRFITPAFLGGADPKGTPELRPPSIKGALRFWWRAMNGHLVIDELRKSEALIFGNTEKRSLVTIRTDHPEHHFNENKWFRYGRQSNSTEKYLFFTTLLKGNEERSAVPERSEFTVHLSSNSNLALKQSVCAFWLWAHFGGIGMRARRGGGNFMATSESVLDIDGLTFNPLKNESVVSYLERNINICLKKCRTATKNLNPEQEFSSLKGSWIVVKKEKAGLLGLGDVFKEFRSGKTGNENLLKKSSFGIPLTSTMPPRRHKSDHTEVIIDDGKIDRRSSPVILRELIFSEQRYWAAIWLKGQLFPAPLNLRYIESKTIAIPNKTGSDDLLTEFMKFLQSKGGTPINFNKI